MSKGLPEAEPARLNPSGSAGIRHWSRTVLGLDRAVGFTVLARFWAGAAGLVTVLLIARFLTPAEQGYYYTFGSLVAMQMIFELGFSFVILQLASHERARLSISADYEITGEPVAHARLASVIQKSSDVLPRHPVHARHIEKEHNLHVEIGVKVIGRGKVIAVGVVVPFGWIRDLRDEPYMIAALIGRERA